MTAKDSANNWIRENSKWFIWALIAVIALWIWSDGKVLNFEPGKMWMIGLLGVLGYIFHLIRKDIRAITTEKVEEKKVVETPAKTEFTGGKPFSLEFEK